MATDRVQQAMEQANENVTRSLQALKRHYDATDDDLATILGKPRWWVQERISGRAKCKPADLIGFSLVFDVSVNAIMTGPAESVREALDHPSDLLVRSTGCFNGMVAA